MVQITKKLLLSFIFGFFWVYGMLTLTSLISSTIMPTSFSTSATDFVKGYSNLAMILGPISIALMNSLVFILLLYYPFNISVSVTGILFGCVFASNNLRGFPILPTLLRLYIEPFAILELGAFVISSSYSFYIWRKKRSKENFKDYRHRFIIVGVVLLTLAAILEWVLING